MKVRDNMVKPLAGIGLAAFIGAGTWFAISSDAPEVDPLLGEIRLKEEAQQPVTKMMFLGGEIGAPILVIQTNKGEDICVCCIGDLKPHGWVDTGEERDNCATKPVVPTTSKSVQ